MAQESHTPFSFRHVLGLVSAACSLPFMLAAFDIGSLRRTLCDALGWAVIVGLAAIGNWIAFGAGVWMHRGWNR